MERDPKKGLGPGLVRAPDGTIPLGQDCVTLSLDYVAEVDGAGGGTDLASFGFDFVTR